jgi:hypothetical protein
MRPTALPWWTRQGRLPPEGLSCGWERLPAVFAKEMYNPVLALQPWHIDIEIHAVDAFNRKRHMIIDDVGDALC